MSISAGRPGESEFLARLRPGELPAVRRHRRPGHLHHARRRRSPSCSSQRASTRTAAAGRCPAGSSRPTRAPRQAARRELAEETGVGGLRRAPRAAAHLLRPRPRPADAGRLGRPRRARPDLPEPAAGGRRRRGPLVGGRRPRALDVAARRRAAGLRPRARSSPTPASGSGPSSSTRRWRPRSSTSRSPSPSCAACTRRCGAAPRPGQLPAQGARHRGLRGRGRAVPGGGGGRRRRAARRCSTAAGPRPPCTRRSCGPAPEDPS